jgi:Lipase maturation factor
MASYWISRLVFEKALALIYLVAFIGAVNQFVPLLGSHGLLPVTRFISAVPFRDSPSLFYLFPKDSAFRAAAWAGVALSIVVLTGLPQRSGAIVAGVVWGLMWVLYLSFVNVGQTFYGFGWESLLLEMGFFAMFLGGRATPPSMVLIWVWRWMLFRLMFGAGLIKMRGDPCWSDLTCLDIYFQTQPMPNPLSWYFHWMPAAFHRFGVGVNHFAELVAPFGYFLPQPIAGIAGLVTIVFQLVLIVSGNLSWLNWLTIVLCIPTLDDRFFRWLPIAPPALAAPSAPYQVIMAAVAVAVGLLSIAPTVNMLSPRQLMNTSYNPLHLVNSYGAFGTITRQRFEIVIEGTHDERPSGSTQWRAYEFKGKPGDPHRRPGQVAPYHLRLDWLMWFAAFSSQPRDEWFVALLRNLLQGDRETISLLANDPFPEGPPRNVRALYYEYRFTTPAERRATGDWWHRDLRGVYVPAVSLGDFR